MLLELLPIFFLAVVQGLTFSHRVPRLSICLGDPLFYPSTLFTPCIAYGKHLNVPPHQLDLKDYPQHSCSDHKITLPRVEV
jgi:hypothetical protein